MTREDRFWEAALEFDAALRSGQDSAVLRWIYQKMEAAFNALEKPGPTDEELGFGFIGVGP